MIIIPEILSSIGPIIANLLPNRIGKQCRERWYNHLDPHIKKGDWTVEEDDIIITQQLKYGNQWSLITKMLPGRTDNSVKNRWHATARARQRAESLEGGYGGRDDNSAALTTPPLFVDKAIPVFETASPQIASAYYSDSELYLDAECLIHSDISKIDKFPPNFVLKPLASNTSSTQTNSGVGWLVFPKDDVVSAQNEYNDELITEWVQTLRSSSGQCYSSEEKLSQSLLHRSITDQQQVLGDISLVEAVGSRFSSHSPTQSSIMLCPSPKKMGQFLDMSTKNIEIDIPPRNIFSPDMMADQYVMDLEGLPHAMELCLSPPLDRITFCSPDTMTMRVIQFEYND